MGGCLYHLRCEEDTCVVLASFLPPSIIYPPEIFDHVVGSSSGGDTAVVVEGMRQ